MKIRTNTILGKISFVVMFFSFITVSLNKIPISDFQEDSNLKRVFAIFYFNEIFFL